MAITVGTDFEYPEVSRVEIEDIVVVTPNGPECLADLGRIWTIAAGCLVEWKHGPTSPSHISLSLGT